jgi:DNA-directed RNA polymerase subunit RPC12/RpoP
LTNKRIIYLPYMLGRLPVVLSKTTSPTLKRVMPLLFALLPLILFQVFLPALYYFSSCNAMNTIFLFLYALPMSTMVAALFLSFLDDYDEASIEIPLEDITIIDGAVPSSLVLKPRNGGTVVLEFKDEASKNSFKENLYSLGKQYTVYRSYAREFILNPDETITVKCPYCGAQTLLDERQREITCNNCGKQYLIPDKILLLIKEESQSQKT